MANSSHLDRQYDTGVDADEGKVSRASSGSSVCGGPGEFALVSTPSS